MAIKSYDLVVVRDRREPGQATELPATFMYSYTFTRNRWASESHQRGDMLMMIAAIIVPYLYSELREKRT